MSQVSMSTRINASADKVWEVIRDFNGLPAIIAGFEKSTMEGSGVGAVRTLSLKTGGPPIVEKLEKFDDKAKTLSYSIITAPVPVKDYFSTMEVMALGAGQCEVKWYSTFEPKGVSEAEAVKVVEGVYAEGFDGLKKMFGR